MMARRTMSRMVKRTGWSLRTATASLVAPMDLNQSNWPIVMMKRSGEVLERVDTSRMARPSETGCEVKTTKGKAVD